MSLSVILLPGSLLFTGNFAIYRQISLLGWLVSLWNFCCTTVVQHQLTCLWSYFLGLCAMILQLLFILIHFAMNFDSLGTKLPLSFPSSVGNSTGVSGESNSSQNSALSFDTESDLVPRSSPSSFTWVGQTSRRFQLDSNGTSSLKFDALVSLPGVYNMNNLRVLARISDDHEPGGPMDLQKPCPPSYVVIENTCINRNDLA